MTLVHMAIFRMGAMLIFATTIAQAAEPQPELRRNPFERPVLEESNASTPASSSETNSGSAPGLRAVLVAGSNSSVDFGGVIIQVGETANGYQLLSVEEGRAIFRNKGKKIVLSLYEQEKGDER